MNRTTLLAELKESNINQLVANEMLQIRGGKKSGKKSGKRSGKRSNRGGGNGHGCGCGCGW